ncbi:MAG: DNA mismatch repair protein MutS [archaeon]
MDYSSLTPMMKQYIDIKKKYTEGILLFRAGDFYEMFYDDAKEASKILNITLTKRGKGDFCAPLAGIPYHALDPYVNKLIRAGKKVVICEQMEDPKFAKGVVKREVTRIITPGTYFSESYENNYLCSISKYKDIFGFSIIDITTGDFRFIQFDTENNLIDELSLIKPKELLLTKNILKDEKLMDLIRKSLSNSLINYTDNLDLNLSTNFLKERFKLKSLTAFGLEEKGECIISCYNALNYLKETQFSNLDYINTIKLYSTNKYLKLDRKTVRHLELVTNQLDGGSKNTLFDLINNSKTAMGHRRLYFSVLHPYKDIDTITLILNSVQELKQNLFLLEELGNELSFIGDIDRIISKIGFGNSSPKDLIALKQSLQVIPKIKELLKNTNSQVLQDIYNNLENLEEVVTLIENSIVNDPPFNTKEGKFIKSSYSKEIFELININSTINSWLIDYENELRNKANIKSLKIKFNKIFGYYIEVPKAYSNSVPSSFIRKQTLVNAERFTTEVLSEKENLVLSSKEKRIELECQIFNEICEKILNYQDKIKNNSKLISYLDVYYSNAKTSLIYDYSMPIFDKSFNLKFTNLRHSLIERNTEFIPNDCNLSSDFRTMIITGPNMAGKSSYMRSVAIAVILGHIGCFVPASSATIGNIDSIFTRVGASDDISHGQSTFLVEMSEVSYILNNATSNSLVILGEIGRGTSTFDGISLAWAIVEYFNNTIKSKNLVATHYHILNKMSEQYEGIENYHVTAKEEEGKLHFYHKLQKGGINKSYGIQVAKLAGINNDIINKALIIQRDLESDSFLSQGNLNFLNKADKEEVAVSANNIKPILYDKIQKKNIRF